MRNFWGVKRCEENASLEIAYGLENLQKEAKPFASTATKAGQDLLQKLPVYVTPFRDYYRNGNVTYPVPGIKIAFNASSPWVFLEFCIKNERLCSRSTRPTMHHPLPASCSPHCLQVEKDGKSWQQDQPCQKFKCRMGFLFGKERNGMEITSGEMYQLDFCLSTKENFSTCSSYLFVMPDIRGSFLEYMPLLDKTTLNNRGLPILYMAKEFLETFAGRGQEVELLHKDDMKKPDWKLKRTIKFDYDLQATTTMYVDLNVSHLDPGYYMLKLNESVFAKFKVMDSQETMPVLLSAGLVTLCLLVVGLALYLTLMKSKLLSVLVLVRPRLNIFAILVAIIKWKGMNDNSLEPNAGETIQCKD